MFRWRHFRHSQGPGTARGHGSGAERSWPEKFGAPARAAHHRDSGLKARRLHRLALAAGAAQGKPDQVRRPAGQEVVQKEDIARKPLGIARQTKGSHTETLGQEGMPGNVRWQQRLRCNRSPPRPRVEARAPPASRSTLTAPLHACRRWKWPGFRPGTIPRPPLRRATPRARPRRVLSGPRPR